MFIPMEVPITNEAKDLAQAYNSALALSDDQYFVFEMKIQDFLNRRNYMQETMNGRALLEALYEVRNQEIMEMQQFLNVNQLDAYVKLKQRLQPIRIDNRVITAL
ncbi:hypothetical protein C1T31_08865 [Hanstruepera neustonica]|uniref:Uncharacterized protein n=2 Tax=Hanstruepera neustonica TaxID=1445657 RepID=A0A2K1DYJ6_9FLAO|nr:hypothetical protein C1T31_08865 [Hanstruepera neustonica]